MQSGEASTASDANAATAEESSAPAAPSAPAASKHGKPKKKASRSKHESSSDDLELRSDAPLRYVVKKGDTLWDISGHFLKKPWLWPELWYNNPDIKNPHLIYPGEVLYLVWVNGHPRLSRTPPVGNQEKLEPQIREQPLSEAIPTIPLDAIRAFLRGPRVVGEKELEQAPYVVEFVGEHLIGGAGVEAYAQNVDVDKNGDKYSLVRKGQIYRDPDDNDKVLGYEAIYIGSTSVTKPGKPSTINLDATTREALRGDRLLPASDSEFTADFFPHAPKKAITGRIISVYDGVNEIGQYQIITLNKGSKNGLEVGHVLSIWQAGRKVPDTVNGGLVQLPDERAGLLMVFKTYESISYALVMKATQAIHVLDKVKSPDAES